MTHDFNASSFNLNKGMTVIVHVMTTQKGMIVIVHWKNSDEPVGFQNVKQFMMNSDKSIEMLTFNGITHKFYHEEVDSFFITEHSEKELE
jgi:hypothetical protein